MESKEKLQELKLRLYNPIKNDELQQNYFDIIEKDLDRLEKYDKAIEIIKRYAVNDGWSNGWVIKFWEMNNKELDLLKEVFK